jgi:hypothetical protein
MVQVALLLAFLTLQLGGVDSLLGLSSALKTGHMSNFMTSTMIPQAVELNTARGTSNALPWKVSMNPKRELSYMPMFETQLEIILAMGMERVQQPSELVFKTSTVKPARIGNLCFKNDKFRKVRMTYFDAGDNVQVRHNLHRMHRVNSASQSFIFSSFSGIQLVVVPLI